MRLLKFKDLINNQTLENKIKFQRQKIKILEDDIKENGDNGFGYKSRVFASLTGTSYGGETNTFFSGDGRNDIWNMS